MFSTTRVSLPPPLAISTMPCPFRSMVGLIYFMPGPLFKPPPVVQKLNKPSDEVTERMVLPALYRPMLVRHRIYPPVPLNAPMARMLPVVALPNPTSPVLVLGKERLYPQKLISRSLDERVKQLPRLPSGGAPATTMACGPLSGIMVVFT